MRVKSPYKKAAILLCLCAFLLACGKTKIPALPYLASDAVVLAFGDSLTHGTGTSVDKAYPAQLERLINHRVLVEATPGDNTADGLRKISDTLDRHAPALLILCLGGNDFLHKQAEPDTVNNLSRIIEQAKDRGISVLLIGVPKPALLGLRGAEFYADLAQRYGLPLENKIVAQLLSSESTRSDRFHPNAAGYAELAQAVATLLQQTGAI
jgi:acyl-CoA thioesterase-1